MLVGLVGKPNVGKSTFFRAATLAQVPVGNYPFVTIKPNHGTAFVKTTCASKHFGVQSTPREGYVIEGNRFVPFNLMDVAGLVPGAHEGLGMGNAFLDDLRQADALIHVIDAAGATNEKGEPIDAGAYDPAKDIQFLEYELDMWYFQILERGWEKFARTVQQTHGDLIQSLTRQLTGLGVTEEHIKETVERKMHLADKQALDWTVDDRKKLAQALRLKTKPMIIAANRIDIASAKVNIERLKVQFPNYHVVPCSAEAEIILREASKKNLIKYIPGEGTFTILGELNAQQKAALDFVKTKILDVWGGTGVQQVLNTAVFDLLRYITIYPGGVNKLTDSQGRVLPDCFLLREGATALDFANKLHTDFGKNFIRAIDVKKKLTVGKEHVLHDGDVVEIVAGK